MPGSTKRRRGRTVVKSIVLLTTDFLCSEKLGRQDRQEHAALDEHAVTRHVFLANTFYTAPAFTADVLEQRIIDFAKTSQLGVASAAILHRFVMNDTVPRQQWTRLSKRGDTANLSATSFDNEGSNMFKPWCFQRVFPCFPVIFRELGGIWRTGFAHQKAALEACSRQCMSCQYLDPDGELTIELYHLYLLYMYIYV